MKYALNLAENGRILSATFPEYANSNNVIVDQLPEGNIANYIYKEGEFIYDEIYPIEQKEMPSVLDRIEA